MICAPKTSCVLCISHSLSYLLYKNGLLMHYFIIYEKIIEKISPSAKTQRDFKLYYNSIMDSSQISGASYPSIFTVVAATAERPKSSLPSLTVYLSAVKLS